jgi:hypothetical protein
MPIRVVLADDVGQINLVTYTVPLTASIDLHQVAVELDGTVVVRVPYTVTAANAN